MIRYISLLQLGIVIFCSGFLFSCKKDEPASPVPVPAKRDVGVPVGVEEHFPVDDSGGLFFSDDKKVAIDVPKNIAAPGTKIILQQISNTCPSSFGKAYRVFADRKLSGPFTIKISYADAEDSVGVNPMCTFGLALQDTSTGIWALQTSRGFSATEKYVSLTTEGGDCALARPVRLTPDYSEILPSGEVLLSVVGNIIIPSGDLCNIFGTNKPAIPIVEDYYLEPHMIDSWKILSADDGTGTLSVLGNKANYTASVYELPPINPVTILVFLVSTDRPLSAKVFVKPNVNGLKIWIGSKEYVFNNDMVYLGISGDGSMGMEWEGDAGMGFMNWIKKFDRYLCME